MGANYREAYRGRSKAELIAKWGDCLREIEETAYWLELLADADLVAAERLQPIPSRVRRIDSDFRNNSETLRRKSFLISFFLLIFSFFLSCA